MSPFSHSLACKLDEPSLLRPNAKTNLISIVFLVGNPVCAVQ